MDIKDILGVSKNSHDVQKQRPKESTRGPRKLEGVKREVAMLMMGGPPGQQVLSNTIAPSADLTGLKEKRKVAGRPIKWVWKQFENPARGDGLKLAHWQKDAVDIPYPFAKFNKQIKVLRYTDQEYSQHCIAPTWSREETDYLVDLCTQFDLRFVVIADRYEFKGRQRTVEDLKARYYGLARKLVEARAAPHHSLADHPLVKYAYNKEYDVERRAYVNKLYRRSREQEAEDLRRTQELGDLSSQKRAARQARERALVEIGCDGTVRDTKGVLSLLTEPITLQKGSRKKDDGGPVRRHATVLRGRTIAETFDGSKAKKIEAVANDYGIEKWLPSVPTPTVQQAFDALRVEMLLLSKMRHMRSVRMESQTK